MKIYIDNDCKCYTLPNEGLREFDVPFFEDKCQTFIEGYRYVPLGETWTRDDGEVFKGEMISPWKDSIKLRNTQFKYEIAQYKAAFAEIEIALGVTSE